MRLTEQEVAEALQQPSPGPASRSTLSQAWERVAEERGGVRAMTFSSVSTDTRTFEPGALFVALVSPKADGHQFIAQALAKGAAGLVVSEEVDTPPNVPVFRVPDTQVAYGQIARRWRDQFNIPVIGVTGSVGKTTVKEMLAAALSPLGPILKTEASQNNETGVPKALLGLTSKHKAAVVEMGMRGAGQIAYLCSIARPTIGVIALIADNHIELLGSRDAIADAKGELLEALPPDGLAVLNADDPYFDHLRAKTTTRVIPFRAPDSAQRHEDESGQVFWESDSGGVRVRVASPSRHDLTNAFAALAVAEALGVPHAEAAEDLKNYQPAAMRMEIVKTKWGGTILNDAYNAAPASVQSALRTLGDSRGLRKIAFLGDMKELGGTATAAHKELAEVIAALGGIDALYAVGSLAAQIPGAAAYFPSSAEAAEFAGQMEVRAGDVVLVKGSRAMRMEQVTEALRGR